MKNVIAVAALAFALGCGGSGPAAGVKNTCVNVDAATFSGTESETFSTGTCPNSGPTPNSVTFAQAAGGCSTTFTTTLLPAITFAGNLKGSDLTWNGSYSLNGTLVTITNATGTFSADLKSVSGTIQFTRSGSVNCTGTATFSYTRP